MLAPALAPSRPVQYEMKYNAQRR